VPSAADVVVAQVTRAIQLGWFLPEDQLPPEREFAVQLGVSRVTLRTALTELEDAGMLQRTGHGSGGGALVVAASPRGGNELGERARRERLVEIFEFRSACEAATAELAAGRRSGNDLERLESAIAELGEDLTPDRFRAADNRFHLAIAEAAGNQRLREAVEDARAAMFEPLETIGFAVVVPSSAAQHRRILAAMVDHVRGALQELLTAIVIAGPGAAGRD